jgi:endonuclease/exonuclease/phosphatase family metal-dependent hydrolase
MKRTLLFLAASSIALLLVQAASAETLKVRTYNMGLLKILGFDFVPIVDDRAKQAPRELARFARENSPHLMLLEEVWDDGHADAIVKELSPLGYSAIRPKERGILGVGSGMVLLTRSPLTVVDWKFTPFTKTTLMDSFVRKGVLEATLEDADAGGTRFALVGTHTVALDTIDGKPKNQGQLDAFLAQAAQIVSAFNARSAQGKEPGMLLGDFNVGPGYADDAYQKIAGSGSMVETGARLFPGAPLVTWDPANPLVKYGCYPTEPLTKIDHVFLRDGETRGWKAIGARLVFDSPVDGLSVQPPKTAAAVAAPLSDHYGFLVEVELTTRE